MGAMHQKIAIFKEENSVWWGTKFSNITKWHYFLDELNLKLKKKTCQEISKITKWHYFLDELNLKFKTKHVIIIFAKYIFWDSWQKLVYNNGPRDAAPSRNVRSKSVKTTEKPRETRARENSNLILPAGYDGPAGS